MRWKYPCHQKVNSIDLGLAILSVRNKTPDGLRRYPLTLQEIGYYCNCTRERVRQIEERGLRKIRQRLCEESPEYLDALRAYMHSLGRSDYAPMPFKNRSCHRATSC